MASPTLGNTTHISSISFFVNARGIYIGTAGRCSYRNNAMTDLGSVIVNAWTAVCDTDAMAMVLVAATATGK